MHTFDGSSQTLFNACRAIAAHDHMHPSPEVDALFARLLSAMKDITPEKEEEAFKQLGELAYQVRDNIVHATGALEGVWARRIIVSEDPQHEITKFPFYVNYRGLVHEEWELVRAHANDASRALFVGSGSFALSLVRAHTEGVAEIVGLDREQGANDRADELLTALGIKGARFVTADAEAFDGYAQFPVIFIAALVGMREDEKARIVGHIAKKAAPGTLLVVRSASGLKKLFYPGFDPERIERTTLVASGKFDTEVLSSVHVLKVE